MNDRSRRDWDRPLRQVESLPGQRLLFDRLQETRHEPPVTPRGERILFEAGHGLPGVKETAQKILWDVD